jgi:hypothetical protein
MLSQMQWKRSIRTKQAQKEHRQHRLAELCRFRGPLEPFVERPRREGQIRSLRKMNEFSLSLLRIPDGRETAHIRLRLLSAHELEEIYFLQRMGRSLAIRPGDGAERRGN